MKQTFVQRTARHERGWGGRTRTTHVPLLSSDEWHQGFFRVPDTFGGDEHTNAQHRANQYRNQKVKEWVEWKRRQGYELVGKPFVTDPLLSPSEREGGDPIDGEGMRVYVRAKFVRTTPMKMPLDLFLHKRDEAKRYGVELEQSQLANPLPEASEHIVVDGGRDSMAEAETRRNQLGIRRELVLEDDTVTGANLVYETPPDEGDQTVTGEN